MGQASNTIYGDIVASETLNAMKRKLANKAFAMNHLTDLSKYAVRGSKTVMVPYVTTEAAQSKTVGGSFDSPSGDGSGSNDMTLGLKVGNPFLVPRDLSYQTLVNLLKEKSDQAAENMLLEMDTVILRGVIGDIPSGQKHDFAGHSVTADKITAADFIAARKALNEAGAALGGRFCFISPKHEAEVIAIDNFVSADKIGTKTNMPIVEGFIGRLYGFDVVLLNHLPKVDIAGAINATSAKNDSYPVIFGQALGYMWAKQLTETLAETLTLSTAEQYVPYNLYGHDKLEDDYFYMVCDKTTADPT